MKYSREDTLRMIKTCERIPSDIDDIYLDDDEIIKAAVTNWGDFIEFASDRLRDDKELAKIAVARVGHNLEYVSVRLRDDEEIVKIAVFENGYNLQYASARLRDDEKIVKIAISECGRCIRYASDRITNDEEMVRMAFMMDSIAIHYVNPRFSNNLDMLILASEYGPLSLQNISNEFLSNRNFLLKLFLGPYAYRYTTDVLLYIDKELLRDYEILYHISLMPDEMSCCGKYCGYCGDCGKLDTEPLKKYIPEQLSKLTNLSGWLKSQLNIKKGNELQLYLNDYDISISFF